jgi:hypothetical protein
MQFLLPMTPFHHPPINQYIMFLKRLITLIPLHWSHVVFLFYSSDHAYDRSLISSNSSIRREIDHQWICHHWILHVSHLFC